MNDLKMFSSLLEHLTYLFVMEVMFLFFSRFFRYDSSESCLSHFTIFSNFSVAISTYWRRLLNKKHFNSWITSNLSKITVELIVSINALSNKTAAYRTVGVIRGFCIRFVEERVILQKIYLSSIFASTKGFTNWLAIKQTCNNKNKCLNTCEYRFQ